MQQVNPDYLALRRTETGKHFHAFRLGQLSLQVKFLLWTAPSSSKNGMWTPAMAVTKIHVVLESKAGSCHEQNELLLRASSVSHIS